MLNINWDVLGELAGDDQDAFLRQTLADLELIDELSDDIIRTWNDGNADGLYALLNESFAEYPDLYDQLITRRNESWMPAIEELIAGDENAVVIVGAFHLVGPDSVIDLLERKGYEPRQL